MFDEMKATWRAFREADPGERFLRYHERLKEQGGKGRVVRMLLGVLLVAAGVAMLVLPGPGILGLLFGVALVAGDSERLAKALDRLEVRARRVANRARHRWRVLGVPARVALVTLAGLVAGAGAWLAWTWMIA